MGKLIETLQRAGKSSGAAIGFTGHAQAAQPKAAAILVSAATRDDALVQAGADIVIAPMTATIGASKADEVALGVDASTVELLTAQDLRSAHEKGAEFAILAPTASSRALTAKIDQFDRVIRVTPPADDPMLITIRALNLLEMQAALLDLQLGERELATLTIEDFAKLRVLSETLRFPTFVTVREVPNEEDLRTVVKLGVQGIWLTKATPATVTLLRERLESMPRESDSMPPISPVSFGGERR